MGIIATGLGRFNTIGCKFNTAIRKQGFSAALIDSACLITVFRKSQIALFAM
jgi:hypothetical protein